MHFAAICEDSVGPVCSNKIAGTVHVAAICLDSDHDLSNSSRHGANGGSILCMPSGYFRHPGTHPHMEIIQSSWTT